MIGARSAVFAPLPRLGLICVDEEHDAVVQAGVRPALRRPHGGCEARVARRRRRDLRKRDAASRELGAARAPRARRADRRPRSDGAHRSTCAARPATRCPRRCSRELGKLAEGGGKAILLLNRRGVAPALHCRACGETRRCPNCDVALVLHRDEALHCHHCGFASRRPTACPACGSVELARIGAGTQRLERELEAHVPELERFRLDADTRSTKPGELAATLRALRRRGARGARRHADGRQGAPLRGRRAGGRDRRRHRSRRAGLPRRGAHVPARHAARRPQRPRRARARARPDVPARVAGRRASPRARTSKASSRASSSAGASSAIRRTGTLFASSSAGRSGRTRCAR